MHTTRIRRSNGTGHHTNSLANLKPFPKGTSGNPFGRSKVDMEFRERCRYFMETEGGWEQLRAMALGADRADRHFALLAIMQYGYGRPIQPIAGQINHSGMPRIEIINALPK